MTPDYKLLKRWGWRAMSIPPAFVLASYLANWSVPLPMRAEAALVLFVTLVRPGAGLILVAFLAPLGDVIVPLLQLPPLRRPESLVLAFLAGWLSSLARDDEPRPTLPTGVGDAMWVFGGIVTGSVAATALALNIESPAALQAALWDARRAYLLSFEPIGLHAAFNLLEGLALVAATAQVIRRDAQHRFWIVLALLSAGIVAAVSSGLLSINVAPAWTIVRQLATGLSRYSAVNADVNATASFYVLVIGIGFGAAMSVPSVRWPWLLVTALLLGGLALAGSGSSLMACAIVLSIATGRWMARHSSSRRTIVGLAVLCALGAAAAAFLRTQHSAISLGMRGGFTRTSLHMIAAQPLLGLGIGRYYAVSELLLPPDLSLAYGRENAHNYYLQTAAELGLVGLIGFGCVIAAALLPTLKRVWSGRADWLTTGCLVGTLGYLITALTGHPFLVMEAVIPYWIVMGLLVGSGSDGARRKWRRRGAVAAACGLVLLAPLSSRAIHVGLAPGEDGFGPARTDPDGRQFRTAGPVSSLYVGPTVTMVEIPLRVAADGPAAAATVTAAPPRQAGNHVLVGRSWSVLQVALPGADVLMGSQRINIQVADAAGVDVGQIRLLATK